MPPKKSGRKSIETLTHDEARRVNIPTAELSSVARTRDIAPVTVAFERRDADLDPQLIWRGKYGPDGIAGENGELLVKAAPLYIQEKVHPKALIDDLRRESEARAQKSAASEQEQFSLFADFNGLPEGADKTEFYRHEQNWANRLILGDSLQVMAGLAEREGLRGQVQCIYFDPPYGIKFNSNFQWSTTSRDVKDNKADHITREPEQVKAFRDTWRDGIHSYLSYLRDRFIVARDLLTESGSIFVQIGDENVHRVRAVLDEVFGEENFVSQITIQTTTGFLSSYISNMSDFVLWYAKNKDFTQYHAPYYRKTFKLGDGNAKWLMFDDFSYRGVSAQEKQGIIPIPENTKLYKPDNIISQGSATEKQPFLFHGKIYDTWGKNSHWKANYPTGMNRLGKAGRIHIADNSIQYVRYHDDFNVSVYGNIWNDTGTGNFTDEKLYVVQTNIKIIERCILMATDPGDLVLDPTCGSGTTAYVAEQWGRRWVTIDTSRVALALARSRIMGARYPYYLLADSPEGQKKEAELAQKPVPDRPTYGNIRHGFVYERVPHITLKSIANNAEIDVIWEKWQQKLEPLREKLNAALGTTWEEWKIPREADEAWPQATAKIHADWWAARVARQKEIDASIAAKADFEFLYDKPYVDNKKVRVAGPFTVESLSPHRILTVDENDDIVDPLERAVRDGAQDFASMILEELKRSGVQQAHKEDKIVFTALKGWPGVRYINAEGRYMEGETERRAAIFIGPEFGSVTRQDLAAAAREAGEAGFELLISCAFNYDAASSDLSSLGTVRILKARMNADLHMSADLKNTGKGNLFVIFGEPDIVIEDAPNNQIQVTVKGVDVFDPATGEVRSDDPDTIACWFIDTDYNEESFFVRHAYFLGAGDPYKSLKTTLKAEIDREAWESLHRATSRLFDRPKSGRIAVKVINHLGDEVMKVYRV
ncbi:site-specific DNA-methyltransferase [uncultured Desulfovibrio sp.]|uniref:site-specific DNA-methyltransferase n=3 Tax=uncultured Desulfovibrio sp. TaxID=167968 RepID=UPI0025D281F1|nr:site-specific DNA-methyltransferase [uncultured Desulfovibrio sp.]